MIGKYLSQGLCRINGWGPLWEDKEGNLSLRNQGTMSRMWYSKSPIYKQVPFWDNVCQAHQFVSAASS